MNTIYLDGHSYTADDLRALVADRDKWEAECRTQRAEVARLAEADTLNGEAIRLLSSQQTAALAELRSELEWLDTALAGELIDTPEEIRAHFAPLLETLRASPVEIDHLEPDDVTHNYPQPCAFVRPDGKRCSRLRHDRAHSFQCDKPVDGERCWLNEHHDGPCQAPLF